MIIDAAILCDDQKLQIARKINILSKEKNSSLLVKPISEIMPAINSGIMLVKMDLAKPLFAIAFEPTGNPLYTEVGMISNLAPDLIRGKHIFPLMIEHYRQVNGNGKKVLYLTSTDIRMIRIAEKSGFIQMKNVRDIFPADVLHFCCSPCFPEKTGVSRHGQQKNRCPRFEGDFIPQIGDHCTRQPCRIFTQIM